MKTLLVGALGLPMLAACATAGPGAPAPAPSGTGICSNRALQQFVGQPATAELGTRVLTASGARALQWVAAGTMVTMEFREDRVRAYLNEQNRVQRISCG